MTDISYKFTILCTPDFLRCMRQLDRSLRIRVDQRIQHLQVGNRGFCRRFDGLTELKWKTGAMGSFRVYGMETESFVFLLGGHKDSQNKDIQKALELMKGVKSGKTRIKVYEPIYR